MKSTPSLIAAEVFLLSFHVLLVRQSSSFSHPWFVLVLLCYFLLTVMSTVGILCDDSTGSPQEELLVSSSAFSSFYSSNSSSQRVGERLKNNLDEIYFHAITYATKDYFPYAEALMFSLIAIARFNATKIYTPDDLDPLFRLRNSEILASRRGAGYWLYKPYIIMHYLLHFTQRDNCIILYVESKYEAVSDIRSALYNWTVSPPHIAVVKNKPRFPLFEEKYYAKQAAFHFMGLDAEKLYEFDSIQCWAGFIAFRRTFYVIQFLSEWLTYSQDIRIINDDLDTIKPEIPGFGESRHDQMIMSLLAKKWKIEHINLPLNMVTNNKRSLQGGIILAKSNRTCANQRLRLEVEILWKDQEGSMTAKVETIFFNISDPFLYYLVSDFCDLHKLSDLECSAVYGAVNDIIFKCLAVL